MEEIEMTPTEISERLQRIQCLFSAGVITIVDMVFLDEETGYEFTVDRVELKDGVIRLVSELEEDETLSGYSVIDLVTEVVNLVGPENYKETLHLEDADGNITMVTSVTLSNGKVTLHHSGDTPEEEA
jgi:hypothetical protein